MNDKQESDNLKESINDLAILPNAIDSIRNALRSVNELDYAQVQATKELANQALDVSDPIAQKVKSIGAKLMDAALSLKSCRVDYFPFEILPVPDNLQENWKYLGKRLAESSWYLQMDMDLSVLKNADIYIQNKDFEALDSLMLAEERKLLHSRLEIMVKLHPERQKVIQEILLAMDAKLYRSVVQLCLAIANGICSKILKADPYTRNINPKNGEKLSKALEKREIKGFFTQIIVASVLENTSMNEKSDEWLKSFKGSGGLNRHEAIHNEHNEDFGTEAYAYKALSWLTFVGIELANIASKGKSS